MEELLSVLTAVDDSGGLGFLFGRGPRKTAHRYTGKTKKEKEKGGGIV